MNVQRFMFAFVMAAGLAATGADCLAAPVDMPSEAGDAAAALVRGDAQAAVNSFSEALKDTGLSNDRRAAILNDRGVAYIKLGQARQAIEDFNVAAQLFPEFAVTYNNRGNLLLSLGLVKEAVKDFDRAIVLAPGYAAAYNNRAGALSRLGKLDDAIRDYSKAIQLLPQNPAPLSGRGRAHLEMMRPHAAIRDFSRAVAQDQRFAAGYRNRAEAKLEIERFDEAIEDFSRAIAFDVTHAESYLLRGHSYLQTRNTVAAIKDFSQAIELDPRSSAAFAARGLAHGMAEAFEEAYGDLNKAIELDPRSGIAFAYRAYVYKQNGQIDVALRDIDVALKLTSDAPEVYWAKAEIAEAQGQTDLAIAQLRKAVGLKPAYREAIQSLQRLGVQDPTREETLIAGAGIEGWRVVARAGRFFAVSEAYPRLSVPLEMMGRGEPRLVEWTLKEPPFVGIGTLRFFGGVVTGSGRDEEVEQIAVVDVEAQVVIAIETSKQGDKVAGWTWQDGKVTIASIEGVTDEFPLRTAQPIVATPYRPGPGSSSTSGQAWAPWSEPWAGGPSAGSGTVKRSTQKKKPKTLFDLLFN